MSKRAQRPDREPRALMTPDDAAVYCVPSDDEIYVAIFNAIKEGQLRPGTKLGEDQLATVFSVGRNRIREVLRQLAFSDLVTIYKNRGAFVAKPTPQEAREVYDARILVESEIAATVARHHKPADLAALEAHLAAQKEAYRSGDRRLYIRRLSEFHLLLAAIAGNKALARFVSQLVAQTTLIVMLFERPGPDSCSLEEHDEMLHRIVAGDSEGSAALMRHHLSAVLGRLSFNEESEDSIDFASIFGRGPALTP